MKRKINQYMLVLAAVAISMALVTLSMVFYGSFRDQVFQDLSTTCQLLAGVYNAADGIENVSSAGVSAGGVRVTLIEKDGRVLFDSDVDAGGMENHLAREEVQQALEYGEGSSVRHSDTISRNTYYYAVLLRDGNLLRVSRDALSLWQFLLGAIPIVVILMFLLLFLSMILAHHLTNRLVRPIVNMGENIEKPGYTSPYPELVPFISTIRSQHQELIKTSELRQEFTANVSHELKTPLTSISGYAELMENGIIQPDEVPYYARQIRDSATRLITLINDIIQLSKLDSPVLEVLFEQVNLYAVARKVVDSMQVNAAAREVTLTLTGSDAIVCGNRGMIEELITNLCDNAVRYNYKGGSVRVSVVPLKGRAILSVQDTGIGIAPEHQGRVVERFYRVDKSHSHAIGGTGLGLSIVKHGAACSNAEVSLQSEEGKGTAVTVQFEDAG